MSSWKRILFVTTVLNAKCFIFNSAHPTTFREQLEGNTDENIIKEEFEKLLLPETERPAVPLFSDIQEFGAREWNGKKLTDYCHMNEHQKRFLCQSGFRQFKQLTIKWWHKLKSCKNMVIIFNDKVIQLELIDCSTMEGEKGGEQSTDGHYLTGYAVEDTITALVTEQVIKPVATTSVQEIEEDKQYRQVKESVFISKINLKELQNVEVYVRDDIGWRIKYKKPQTNIHGNAPTIVAYDLPST